MPNVGPLELLIVVAIPIGMIVLLYFLIVFVARSLHRVLPATTPPRDPAVDALRTRLANGEIDEAEFQRLRAVLERNG